MKQYTPVALLFIYSFFPKLPKRIGILVMGVNRLCVVCFGGYNGKSVLQRGKSVSGRREIFGGEISPRQIFTWLRRYIYCSRWGAEKIQLKLLFVWDRSLALWLVLTEGANLWELRFPPTYLICTYLETFSSTVWNSHLNSVVVLKF